MVEGIKFDITADELKQHFIERSVFHAEEQMRLEAAHIDGEAERHGNASKKFDFMAKHLSMADTYRLTQCELGEYEFITGYCAF